MAETLSNISVVAQFFANLNNSIDGGNVTPSPRHGWASKPAFTTGTSSGNADKVWQDKARTLSSAGTIDIDVYDLGSLDIGAGAGLSALGQAFANAEIALLFIENLSSSAGNLLVGGNGTTAAWNSLFNSDDDAQLVLPPDSGVLLWCRNDPAWAVADTSNHLLRLTASGGDCDYDIGFLGRSA